MSQGTDPHTGVCQSCDGELGAHLSTCQWARSVNQRHLYMPAGWSPERIPRTSSDADRYEDVFPGVQTAGNKTRVQPIADEEISAWNDILQGAKTRNRNLGPQFGAR